MEKSKDLIREELGQEAGQPQMTPLLELVGCGRSG